MMSEYIGIYLLVLSIPLVINVITTDVFLRIVTLLSSLGGFAIYQFSNFSLLERHFKNSHRKLSSVIVLFGAVLFVSQLYSSYFVELSALFMVFILGILYSAAKINSTTKK